MERLTERDEFGNADVIGCPTGLFGFDEKALKEMLWGDLSKPKPIGIASFYSGRREKRRAEVMQGIVEKYNEVRRQQREEYVTWKFPLEWLE